MSDKKFEYRVDSPIKFKGKRRNPGESVLMTEEQAEGLHVTKRSGGDGKAAAGDNSKGGGEDPPPQEIDLSKGSRAHDDWREVVDFIEATPYETLAEAGFVSDDENRTSVLKAWEAKQPGDDEQ